MAQLFHTFEPFPFRERDLDTERRKYALSAWHENTQAGKRSGLEFIIRILMCKRKRRWNVENRSVTIFQIERTLFKRDIKDTAGTYNDRNYRIRHLAWSDLQVLFPDGPAPRAFKLG